jgi:hypothetical protein
MTATSEESPDEPGTAWTTLFSNLGLGFLFELNGEPWISWVSWIVVLGAVLLGLNLAHLLLCSVGHGESGIPRFPGFPASITAATDIITPAPSTIRHHHHHHGYYCCHHPHTPLCEAIAPLQICSSPNPLFAQSPSSYPLSLPDEMIMSAPASSVETARRLARDFDYPSDQVQRGVTEFIREIHEGLSKQAATLSQIPTYVTSVPNGTEKVRPDSTFFTCDPSWATSKLYPFLFVFVCNVLQLCSS